MKPCSRQDGWQDRPFDTLVPVWHHPVTMSEIRRPSSITCAALGSGAVHGKRILSFCYAVRTTPAL